MNNNKREERQGNTNKEQGENTYIRRRTTTKETAHAIKAIERQENMRNHTQHETREEEEETR